MHFTTSYTLPKEQYKQFFPLVNTKFRQTLPLGFKVARWGFLLFPAVVFFLSYVLILHLPEHNATFTAFALFWGYCIGAFPTVLLLYSGLTGLYKRHYGNEMHKLDQQCGPISLSVTEDECQFANNSSTFIYKWHHFTDISQTKTAILLWSTPFTAEIIPKSIFKDEKEQATFIEFTTPKIKGNN